MCVRFLLPTKDVVPRSTTLGPAREARHDEQVPSGVGVAAEDAEGAVPCDTAPSSLGEETRGRLGGPTPFQMNVPVDTCGDVEQGYRALPPGTMALSYRARRPNVQSSGILIQPWRIAYTTAWVRSLTESLRRIELMWFFTVCSLIDSA